MNTQTSPHTTTTDQLILPGMEAEAAKIERDKSETARFAANTLIASGSKDPSSTEGAR